MFPGTGKTGTTALQETLRRSKDALHEAGWNYLHDPRQGELNSLSGGNAGRMFRTLSGEFDFDPVAEFERLAPAGQRSIISNEGLSELDPEHWRPVLDLLEREGGTVRSVCCFRDLYPFVWSSYNQRVSVRQESAPFDRDWMPPSMGRRTDRPLFDVFEFRFPDSPCVTSQTVLHYESIRSDAVRQMLSAAGLPVEVCDLEATGPKRPPLNRSHSQPELALIRRLNANLEPYRAWWSGFTLSQRPYAGGKVRLVFVPEVHHWLEENVAHLVERFNDSLPDGTDWRLSILDESAYDFEEFDPDADQSPEYADAIYYLLSFNPADDYRDYLISLLPGGVYDPPSPSPLSRLRGVAAQARRRLKPSSG